MSEQLESRLVLTASGFPGNDCPPDLDLSAVGDLQVVVGQPLVIDLYANGATAVDLDINDNPTGDTIRLVLDPDVGTDTPLGATITTDGVFRWTPSAEQVGTFRIPVIAIDQGTPFLADVEFLTVIVSATGDQAPSVDLNGPAAGVGFSGVFTENGGPVAATSPSLTITDLDSTNLESATIILTNIQDGADELLAVNTTGTSITASSFNSTTGELTLTGSDSLANYAAVLQSLTYNNASEDPTVLDRIIQITVNDGGLSSPIVVSTISIVPENDAPTVDLNGEGTGIDFAATFTEGNGPLSIVDGVLVDDVDNVNLTSATVTLTNVVDTTTESLSVDTTGTTITAQYDSGTGVLTLTGTASLADYQLVLSTLTYDNTSENPDETDRIVEVVVNDGTTDSAAATVTITVEGVNDPPDLEPIADQTAQLGTLFQITVTATDPEGDVLTFQLDREGSGANIPASATITKTSDTTAVIEWTPEAGDGAGPFTFVVIVTDDDPTNALSDSEEFDVSLIVAPPEVDLNGEGSGIDFAASFTEEDGPTSVVDPTATVTDNDSANLESATITITNLVDTNDEILAVDVGTTSIVAQYDGATGILTLTGTASVAEYQQVIRTLTYDNLSQNPDETDRIVEVVVNDGANDSATATVTVSVEGVNDPPDLEPIDPQTAQLGTTFQVTVTATDPEGDVLTFQLDREGSGANIPASATITKTSDTTAVIEWTPEVGDGAGPFTFFVVVIDDDPTTPLVDSENFIVSLQVELPEVDLNGEGSGIAFAASFTEGDGPTSVVDPTATVTDTDSTNLTSATITLTNLVDTNNEILTVDVGTTSIGGQYDGATGILTLTGSASVADYQQVIRTLTYDNLSDDPDTVDRVIEVIVNDGFNDSATATITVSVTAENDFPQLTLPSPYDTGTAVEVDIDTEVTFDVSVVDPDTPPENLIIFLDLDTSGIPLEVAQPTITTPGGTFSWTPTQTGTFTITVVVTDGGDIFDQETFILTVVDNSAASLLEGEPEDPELTDLALLGLLEDEL
ncbi:Ig-like domain-containing protein [Bremerella sp. JC770]|uniref:putative Ig domain-containing protein n=1 Tax=Bremerella sp. JC770 TaxID=3232137 RepID=UPI00345869E9